MIDIAGIVLFFVVVIIVFDGLYLDFCYVFGIDLNRYYMNDDGIVVVQDCIYVEILDYYYHRDICVLRTVVLILVDFEYVWLSLDYGNELVIVIPSIYDCNRWLIVAAFHNLDDPTFGSIFISLFDMILIYENDQLTHNFMKD